MSSGCSTSCRHGLQKFADDTTMHGFMELYYAKSLTWKLIWFVLIFGALGITGYQLYNTMEQAFEMKTTTVVEPLSTTPKYPPLKICYLHWSYWVNFTLASQLGFDRNAVLYGMAYMTPVVSVIPFDVNQTKTKFVQVMQKNNFKRLFHFYQSISNPQPPGITLVQLDWPEWNREIDPYAGRLCYIADTNRINEGLAELATQATDFKSSIQLNYEPIYFQLPKEMYPFEYKQYLSAVVVGLLRHPLPSIMPVDLTTYKAAPILNVDNVRINFIMPAKETFQSQIKITGTLFRWMNNDKRPCVYKEATEQYDYCDKICSWQEVMKMYPGRCIDLRGSVLFEDTIDSTCINNFIFPSPNNTIMVPGNVPANPVVVPPTASFNACISNLCAKPCEEWKYASTASTLPVPAGFEFLGFPTLLYVEYPEGSNILVMTEIYAQTWEIVIGNVGGIIGLWLGGSVMSLIQLVYLCCFSICDEKLSTIFMNRPSRNLDVAGGQVIKPTDQRRACMLRPHKHPYYF